MPAETPIIMLCGAATFLQMLATALHGVAVVDLLIGALAQVADTLQLPGSVRVLSTELDETLSLNCDGDRM